MNVILNGEPTTINEKSTLQDILKQFNIEEASVVIELNEKIIKKEAWQSTTVEENDRIELISFVGGG